MSKTHIFVSLFSGALVATFVALCYVMSMVNPPPIFPNTTKTHYTPENITELEEDMVLQAFYRNLEYNSKETKLSENFNKSDYLLKTVSTRSLHLKLYATTVLPKANNTEQYVNENLTTSDELKEKSTKGRRSIINNVIKEIVTDDSGIIKLKILDAIGYPKIEIKLHTNNLQNNVNESFYLQDQNIDKEYEVGDIQQNTEIKILPNNSIFIQKNLAYKTNYDNSSADIFSMTVDKSSNDSVDIRTNTYSDRTVLYRNKIEINDTNTSFNKREMKNDNIKDILFNNMANKISATNDTPQLSLITDAQFNIDQTTGSIHLENDNSEMYNTTTSFDDVEHEDFDMASYVQLSPQEISNLIHIPHPKSFKEKSAIVGDITEITKYIKLDAINFEGIERNPLKYVTTQDGKNISLLTAANMESTTAETLLSAVALRQNQTSVPVHNI